MKCSGEELGLFIIAGEAAQLLEVAESAGEEQHVENEPTDAAFRRNLKIRDVNFSPDPRIMAKVPHSDPQGIVPDRLEAEHDQLSALLIGTMGADVHSVIQVLPRYGKEPILEAATGGDADHQRHQSGRRNQMESSSFDAEMPQADCGRDYQGYESPTGSRHK